MPFLAQEHHQIPNKDILSWMFDDITYDLDDPLYINAEHPEENRISARQAKRMIRQLVAGFRAIGVQKGDCVSIHSFNDIHYPLFFLAIVGAGAVFAATNPAYTPHELAHTLKTAQAKYVLTQETLLDSALEAAKEVGIADQNVIIFNPTGPPTNSNRSQWSDLLQHGEEDWIRFDDYETSSNTTAAFLFSSGTTGLPKAVCLSHYNFIAEIALLFEAHPRPWRIHYLFALPMFHAATSFTAFCLIIRLGAKGFVFPRFDLEKWFWAIQEYAITDLAIVPPIAVMAVNSALNRKYSMQSVRLAWAGAAPIDAALQARMQALMPNASLTQVYGMTESSCVAFTHRWPETDTTGSIGYPLPNMDCKLVDDDGKDISGYDVRGEICMRGALVTKGYFQNSEANARDWDEEGYFHTGDIAFVDGKTKLWYIVDRKKELIKVRGFQVSPGELEGVLLSHPDIVDCAVLGVTNPQRQDSELVKAYVVRRNVKSNKPTPNEIIKFMRKRLSSYKTLTGGIVFTAVIPKSASGKILKRVLKEQMKEEQKAKL